MFAHTNPQYPTETDLWEPLHAGDDGHLNKVAELCAAFAADAFRTMENSNGCWHKLGRLAGDWQDLSTFSDAFQNYLKCSAGKDDDARTSEIRGRVDHTPAGAQHAVKSLPPGIGALLAYPIAGHHAGLLDGLATRACLKARLTKNVPGWRHSTPDGLLEAPSLELPEIPGATREKVAFNLAFATRRLFMMSLYPKEHIRLPPHIYSSCRIKTSQQRLHPEFGAANQLHCNYRHY